MDLAVARTPISQLSLGGLVARQQLIDAGYSPDLGQRRVERGTWSRQAPGLYLTSPGPADLDQRRLAALVHGGPGAVLCGPGAAVLHGARDVPVRAVVDVLIPHLRQVSGAPGVRVHRTRRWPAVGSRQGWPVTPIALSVVQAARWAGSLRDARAVVLASVGDGLCTVELLESALDVGGSVGLVRARRAVLDARRGAWSAPEAEGADLLVPEVLAGRLPPFWLNAEVWEGSAKLGVVDLLVKGRAFGAEIDSVTHHSGEHLSATFDRHEVFAGRGVTLLHRTPGRMRSAPGAWVRAVVAGAAAAGPMPAGLRVVPRGPLLPEGDVAHLRAA